MKKIINLYKPLGLTPLQAIEKFREKHKPYHVVKMGYAGRLDPMAEGVLLVLIGDENKNIRQYLSLDKEYKAKILFGFSSDSHDVLGIAKKGNLSEINIKELKKKLKNIKGNYEQKIPKYSSYRVKGKPMFYYALKGEKIEDVKKNVKIKDVKIRNVYKISSNKLLKLIVNKIKKVDGNFRQKEIKERWKDLLENSDDRFFVAEVVVECSSGTYIRAIADDAGSDYNGGLLLSLKRTRVGRFEIKNSKKLK